MPSGRNIGNITADINNTVINGTPLQNSIKVNDEYFTTGNSDLLPRASIIPIGKQNIKEKKDESDLDEIEKKIIKILETKIRPAVARDGGDITFKEFKDGKVTVMLKGSCSGCPSSTLTLKQGVQNLLCHYIPEVKEVLAV